VIKLPALHYFITLMRLWDCTLYIQSLRLTIKVNTLFNSIILEVVRYILTL